VTERVCLEHCRREFFDLHAACRHPAAVEMLRRIGELYAAEPAFDPVDRLFGFLSVRQKNFLNAMMMWQNAVPVAIWRRWFDFYRFCY
jgi:hypothetical protein